MNAKIKPGPKATDFTGRKIGLLTVIEISHRALSPNGSSNLVWRCRCECGNEKMVMSSHLTRQAVKSCGCMTATWKARNATTHGQYGSGTYRAWIEIMRRCRNPKCKHWPRYGGRGIAVCDRWTTFENFRADMGDRPTPKHEVDRIDNNGNYEPGNCRWATRMEQMANVSSNVWITANGDRRHISDWARHLGADAGLICARIRNGWTQQQAVTTPVNAHIRTITAFGETLPITQWATRNGLNVSTIRRRLGLGWTPERAVSEPLAR